MASKFPRGSEWRMWDLHVHTPETKLNDQYKTNDGQDVWDSFCSKIEESDVQAFGIADYFSADCYFNFTGKFGAKYPESSKEFFPNIELRTSDVVNAAKEEVNTHLIFNPAAAEIDSKIRIFLQSLNTTKTTADGRNIKASELSNKDDYEAATTTREFIEQALKGTFGSKVDLTKFVLIFTAANNDGIRTETEKVNGKRRGVKRKALLTDEFDKFSNGFFGNASNTTHYLDPERLEVEEKVAPKPVITGSDAHSFSDIDDWLGKTFFQDGVKIKEPTWIKIDLTFEGLRQTIFEPADRVFIGEEPEVCTRLKASPRKFIKCLKIHQRDGYDGRCGSWFQNEDIPLNGELVAIIGNKGSGKSAITDSVGLLGNSHNKIYGGRNGRSEELFSFLNKEKFLKGQCADNFQGELHWHAGDPDVKMLNADTNVDTLENVEYLPQKYLEKICSNINDDEFRYQLNEVIFGYVEEKNRYAQPDLESLINYLSNQAQEDIVAAKQKLHEKNEKVVVIEEKLSDQHLKEIQDKADRKAEELEAHEEAMPEAVPEPQEGKETIEKGAAEIASIAEQVDVLDDKIVDLRKEQTTILKDAEDLRQLKAAAKRQVHAISELGEKHKDILEGLDIDFKNVLSVSSNFDEIDAAIIMKVNRGNEIVGQLNTEDDVAALDPALQEGAREISLVCKKVKLVSERKAMLDKLDKPNRDYQAYVKRAQAWEVRKKEIEGDGEEPGSETLKGLNEELRRISDTYSAELSAAREARDQASREVFKMTRVLVSFYGSVKKSIDAEIGSYGEDLGDYDISIHAGLRFDSGFHDEFFRYINQSVRGNFHGSEDGKAALKKILDSVDDWEDEDEVISCLQEIVSHLDSDTHDESAEGKKTKDIFKQMKKDKDPVDLYDFIFGFNYLETKYDLEVDGKDLSELSPGERGGLLLIFYLMLDRRDVPLVIDQPEDNLDNKSVYEILVTFLKKAKRRRQIIMVTHNPNLAVVADAEQIIHVSIDKKGNNDFDFYSGGIEDPGINRRVVDILEGTLPAFDNRRIKYRRQ